MSATSPAQVAVALPQPNDEQAAVIETLATWVNNRSDSRALYVLKAPAGCGKTFCLRHLVNKIRGRIVFTAPTNKATKVLREQLTTPDYRPDCRTIYSLLGLSLSADGEVKVLTQPEDPVDLTDYRLVVVDEGSMLNKEVVGHIRNAALSTGVKILFLGDPAQLPPVKETTSPIWQFENVLTLTKVMRHDNQILAFATSLRHLIDQPFGMPQIKADAADGQGIFTGNAMDFHIQVAQAAELGELSKPDSTKVIAWRNATVDNFNRLARQRIFPETWHEAFFQRGDRVIFTAPASDSEDKPIGKVDDEGTITNVYDGWHWKYNQFKTQSIGLTMDDGRLVIAQILHPSEERRYQDELNRLSSLAKDDRKKWRDFWAFKEAFHQLRHSYAITAHRSQGSTYEKALVNYRDIMVNKDRSEALRCLYVACTRPKKVLFLG
jgi:ATP-dependent exoDNAse (exonuclease V) alpha subunit